MQSDPGDMASPEWLPAGWTTQIHDKNGRRVKTYIDPESGRKFYSKPQVFQYIESIKNGTEKSGSDVRASGRKYYSQQEVSHRLETVNRSGSENIQNDHLPREKQLSELDMFFEGNESPESGPPGWVVQPRTQVVTPNGADGGGTPSKPDASQGDAVPEWLPDGWIMEIKTRESGVHSGQKYKCFTDPESGRRFFSKPQVLKYLATRNSRTTSKGTGGKAFSQPDMPGTFGAENKYVGNGKPADPKVISRTPAEGLPPGWIKEVVSRDEHSNQKDPFYVDPGSGYVFRSKRDAWRYLDTGDINKCVIRPKKRVGDTTVDINKQISEIAATYVNGGTISSAKTSQTAKPGRPRSRKKRKGVKPGNAIKSAKWDEVTELQFIELCENEIKKGNSLEDGLENIAQELNKTTGSNHSKKQLKNHLDKMKAEYKLWLQLNRGESGIAWDFEKNNFAVGDEWWDRKVKENKDYAKFRGRNLKLIKEKFPPLFDGIVATEDLHTPRSSKRSSRRLINYNEDMQIGDGYDINDPDGFGPRLKRQAVQGQNSSRREDRLSASAISLQSQIDSLVQVMKGISSAASSANPPHATVDDCMNYLKEIVEPKTRFWNFACNLLTKGDNRDVFMRQPDAEARLSWLEYNFSLETAMAPPPPPPPPSSPPQFDFCLETAAAAPSLSLN